MCSLSAAASASVPTMSTVVVCAGGLHLQAFDERLRRMAQLKQAQRRDYIEDVLPQRKQRDDDRRPYGAEEHSAEAMLRSKYRSSPQ